MAEPLSSLSPSRQNIRSPPCAPYSDSRKSEVETEKTYAFPSVMDVAVEDDAAAASVDRFNQPTESQSPPSSYSPRPTSSHGSQQLSPLKMRSPIKYRLQDDMATIKSSLGSPAESTTRFGEGQTQAMRDPYRADEESTPRSRHSSRGSTIVRRQPEEESEDPKQPDSQAEADESELDITLSMDKTIHDDTTMGDLSTISAIATDLTRFANLRSPPVRSSQFDGISPSKAHRNSIAVMTPATGQRPLTLLSRHSTSSNEDDEETPRRRQHNSDGSPVDLLNFTSQTSIHIPPPSTSRTSRRSPSGRGAFPIRVNPTPSHRSQASIDRERGNRSPQRGFPDRPVHATPAANRHSMISTSSNGFGLDLLDIDLEPLATPRSIPTVTPRELESLRSELQSRICGLEATLSGKEAEVTALKRAVTDAEVRVGKTSEELRHERMEKETLQAQKEDFEGHSREMEGMLRELKQNAFVEEHEREKLRRQAEEAERRTEEHEVRILELNASLDTLRSERLAGSPKSRHVFAAEPATPGQVLDIDAAVKNATETVARELHTLYKSKHERKVADLKLSYEKRWIKQVDALKADLRQSQEEVSRLLRERDVASASSNIVPGQSEALSKMEGQIEELRRRNDEVSAEKKVVEAESSGLRGELDTFRKENDVLRANLETERVEKGDLVAQVEVFLAVSAEQERERERERQEREAADRERQPASPPRSDASGESTSNSTSTSSSHNYPGGYNGHNYNVSNGNTYAAHAHNGANPGSGTTPSTASPLKPRLTATSLTAGRSRPMSMLAKPSSMKYGLGGNGSGIPGPGSGLSGLKAPTASAATGRAGMYTRPTSSFADGLPKLGGQGR